jgi:hypothetical protein
MGLAGMFVLHFAPSMGQTWIEALLLHPSMGLARIKGYRFASLMSLASNETGTYTTEST